MSSNKFALGHSMKMEWLIANATAVGSPDRAGRAILGVFVVGRVFGQSRSFFVVGELICGVGIPFEL